MSILSSNNNIRDLIAGQGLANLGKTEQKLAEMINSADMANQAGMLQLQMETTKYNNNISLMTTILKGLGDVDKEVIRNS